MSELINEFEGTAQVKDEITSETEHDPNDTDVHDAATKIQGGYRSMKSRETIKNQQEDG